MHVTKYEKKKKKKIYFDETQLKIKKYPKRYEEKIIKIYPKVLVEQLQKLQDIHLANFLKKNRKI